MRLLLFIIALAMLGLGPFAIIGVLFLVHLLLGD